MRKAPTLEGLLWNNIDILDLFLIKAYLGMSYVRDVEGLDGDLAHLLEFFHQLVFGATNARVICSLIKKL
jgi:hypothetical protein